VSPLLDGPAAAALGPELVEARIKSSPAWLADRRRAAWDAFQALPMPSSLRDEDWRRTDISRLRMESFIPLDEVDASFVAAMRRQRDRAAEDAAFVIDAPIAGARIEGADPLLAQGVIVTTLEEAAVRHTELVQRALGSLGTSESKFTALWNALWRGGVFIYVPPGVDAMAPIWVAHPSSGSQTAVFPATVALLGEAASLTLVDVHASPAGTDEMFSDTATALVLGRDARLDYHSLQQWGEGVWHVALQRAVLGANARLRFFGATLGSRLQKAYWETILEGTGSEADIWGICFGDGNQHLDHQSLQAHRGSETRSNLSLKVAVRDKARSVYSGLIDVEPRAIHADGYVQNRNLLLSPGAKADSVPRLEIRANDVRCGHGATAGHVDEDQRFYLMARGVPRSEAEALIVRAFFDDTVKHVPLAGFGALVSELLEAEIAGITQAGLAEAG
jgi:Fe-S cluster assembly protein SufD